MAYEKLKEQIIKDCLEHENELLERLRPPPFPRPIKCYYGRPVEVSGGPEISAEVFRAIYRGDIF